MPGHSPKRGQSAMEYLLLVGGAVAVVLAILLITNGLQSQSNNQIKIGVNSFSLFINQTQSSQTAVPAINFTTPVPTP
jgi:hypothetical protein